MSGQLTAADIRAAIDSLKGRSIAPHNGMLMYPYAVADLLNDIDCPCGKPATRRPRSGWRRCDGCYFRYKVMKAAGRLDEFLKSSGYAK